MRRAFLALFGGAAAAQMRPENYCVSEGCASVKNTRYKPKNGECPVCGTMAPKRYDKYLLIGGGGSIAVNGPCPTGERCEYRKNLLARCSHCSNAFYQDAEVAK